MGIMGERANGDGGKIFGWWTSGRRPWSSSSELGAGPSRGVPGATRNDEFFAAMFECQNTSSLSLL